MKARNTGFGKRLLATMKYNGYDQNTFAEELDKRTNSSISKQKLSAWCQLNDAELDAMSEILGTDCRNFFTS